MPSIPGTLQAESDVDLRPWREDEAPVLWNLVQASHRSLGRWIPWYLRWTPVDAQDWLEIACACWTAERVREFPLAIVDRTTNAPLGMITAQRFHTLNRSAHVGS